MNSVSIADGLISLHFEDAAQPVFLEKKGKEYVYYGEKNDYPDYLLYLYNNSAKHSAIINGKVDYVCGKGWGFNKESAVDTVSTKSFIQRANKHGESLDDVTNKLALDAEIFNGGYLQITWSPSGTIADIYHLDYTTVRSNKDNSMFFVSDEWVTYNADGSYKTNSKPKYEPYAAFNPGNKSGTQILYVKKYHPGIDIYTLPTYRGSITWIEVDVEIGNYHLNNVKSGFFVNKLINFNNGKPSEEEQKTIERLFDKKFGGVRGKKYIFSYNADSTKAATVLDLNISESDKIFDQLNKSCQQEIFTGHRITSGMLFGIKTEGQLGGRTELREAYETFQNTYVNGRQQWIEKVFNMLAGYAGVSVPLTIQRSEPIGFEFGESTIAANLTRDEIRDYIADRLSIKLQADKPAPPAAQFADNDAADAAMFADFGVQRDSVVIMRSKKVRFRDDQEEALHFAVENATINDTQAAILDLLAKDPLMTAEVIAKTIDVAPDIVARTIDALIEDGLLKVSEKRVRGEKVVELKPTISSKDIIRNTDTGTSSIQVMYSYEGPQDGRNRPFCARMLQLNRLYSRKDIEAISGKLGYSVWARRGGWYHNPDTGKNQPFCRHSWASNVVVKKK
jgi:DNA-binding MarR family transcriptional regulator